MYPQQIDRSGSSAMSGQLNPHTWAPLTAYAPARQSHLSLSLSFIALLFLSLTLWPYLSQFLFSMSLFGSSFWLHCPGEDVQAQDEARLCEDIQTGSREDTDRNNITLPPLSPCAQLIMSTIQSLQQSRSLSLARSFSLSPSGTYLTLLQGFLFNATDNSKVGPRALAPLHSLFPYYSRKPYSSGRKLNDTKWMSNFLKGDIYY